MKPIENDFTVSSFTKEGFAIDTGAMEAERAADLQLEPASLVSVELVEPDSSSEQIVTGKLQSSY